MNSTEESSHPQQPPWLLAFLGVAFFTCFGWGHWGYSIFGDYILDTADALRFSQGDIPYRDFIPTYGPLHMVLASPFFHLGQWGFPCLWLASSVLILFQLLLLLRFSSRLLSRPWQFTLLALAITTMAYPPTNAKLVLGYSSSGFLATLLFTVVLALLCHPHPCQRRWLAAGICLGLTPFTKIDLGFTGFAVVMTLTILWHRAAPFAVLGLAISYGGTWLAGCGLLVLYGAQPPLLLGSTLECFGQAIFFNDANLALRIKLLIGMGGCLVLLLLIPGIRQRILCFEKQLRPFAVFLLPAAMLIDAFRTRHDATLKQMVMFNWYSVIVFVLVGAHVTAAILRRRSFRPLRSGHLVILTPLLVITGMGILRVIASSWYPLNYFNPAVLLLGILWTARQMRYAREIVHRLVPVAVWLCLLLSLHGAIRGCRPQPFPLEWIPTPYGSVGFILGPRQHETYTRLLGPMQRSPGNGFLLCTYEPTFHILTGMRTPALYTYFTRLGLTGQYGAQREAKALELIRKSPPDYIIQDHETGPVHKRFGIEFGMEIEAYIRKNYVVVDQVNGSTLLRKKVGGHD